MRWAPWCKRGNWQVYQGDYYRCKIEAERASIIIQKAKRKKRFGKLVLSLTHIFDRMEFEGKSVFYNVKWCKKSGGYWFGQIAWEDGKRIYVGLSDPDRTDQALVARAINKKCVELGMRRTNQVPLPVLPFGKHFKREMFW